jgi:hypothetical protein
MSVIPALRRLRREDHEYEASLGCEMEASLGYTATHTHTDTFIYSIMIFSLELFLCLTR